MTLTFEEVAKIVMNLSKETDANIYIEMMLHPRNRKDFEKIKKTLKACELKEEN